MKLLVADDSSLYRKMLHTLLEAWGYEVVLASDGFEAQRLLDTEDAPRLALLDCVMPGLSGLELCEIIRTRKKNYVYTILLSANGEQADVVRGFELGADDFLRKPFEEFELRARLKVGERIIRAHEELVDAREALKFEATHDSLVGLWNRRAIMDLLSKELSRAKRLNTPFSIFLADLDFFKHVNDSHGHLVGDDVLRTTAARITSAVRDYDHVGRYGGEEFLVVLPDCTAELAKHVAERARLCISEEPVMEIPVEVKISASIGVCQWHSGQGVNDLLREADVAMYRAKDNGRNRVEVANGDRISSQ
jgi:two-component system, cell cycle response regulator